MNDLKQSPSESSLGMTFLKYKMRCPAESNLVLAQRRDDGGHVLERTNAQNRLAIRVKFQERRLVWRRDHWQSRRHRLEHGPRG